MTARKEREAPLELRERVRHVVKDVLGHADIHDMEDPWVDRLMLAVATVMGPFTSRRVAQFGTRFIRQEVTPDGFHEYVEVHFQ